MTYPAGASQGARQVVCLERITGIVAVTARLPLRGAGVPPVCRRNPVPGSESRDRRVPRLRRIDCER